MKAELEELNRQIDVACAAVFLMTEDNDRLAHRLRVAQALATQSLAALGGR
jgi:hypothetical protein